MTISCSFAFSGSFWGMYHDCFVGLLLAFITNRVILGKSVGERRGGQENIKQKGERRGQGTEIRKSFEMCGRTIFTFFQDVTFPQICSLAFSRGSFKAHWNASGHCSEVDFQKTQGRLTSQTKNQHVYLWKCWQPKHAARKRVCKTAQLLLNPSCFLDRKKNNNVVLVVVCFFLVTNSVQTLACLPWLCCVPESSVGLVGNPRVSACGGPWVTCGAVPCDLLGELQCLWWYLPLQICHEPGHNLKFTFNKKQVKT